MNFEHSGRFTVRTNLSETWRHSMFWLIQGVGILLASLSFLLLTRRILGRFVTPLDGTSMLLVVGIGVLATTGLRVARRCMGEPASRLSNAWLFVPAASLIAVTIAVHSTGVSYWAAASCWLAVACSEIFWWKSQRPAQSENVTRESVTSTEGGELDRADRDSNGTVNVLETTGESNSVEESNEEIRPSLSRLQEDGFDILHGVQKVTVEARERVAQLHIAFYPPFPAVPELQAYTLEGPAATLKVAKVETFGTRLELRVASLDSEKQEILVEFNARCPLIDS